MATTRTTPSRQVRRAEARFFAKLHRKTYPKGLNSLGLQIQRYEPFEPTGQNWRGWPDLGKQEAARRLARMAMV